MVNCQNIFRLFIESFLIIFIVKLVFYDFYFAMSVDKFCLFSYNVDKNESVYSMAKKEKSSKKKGSKFKYVLIFLFFVVVGVALGVFGTMKYLDYKNSLDDTPVVEEGPVDISDSEKYSEQLDSLLGYLNNDPLFYSTKGVKASTLDNTSRLILIYEYIVKNELSTSEVLQPYYYGAPTCNNGIFVVDSNINSSVTTTVGCTVNRISKTLITETSLILFNDQLVDTSVNFDVNSTLKCVLDQETYICGNVQNTTGYSGELESNFEIIKATKDTDGTIAIYEKGYLHDKRSYVDNLTDQYDNYYLHSSDSKEYYYELKSADNLIFKHVFKTNDLENYYYVSTELVKE